MYGDSSLPDYPIAAIRTGQDGSWEVNLYPPADPDTLRAAYAALSDIPPEAGPPLPCIYGTTG